jgi:hypothetical protein
MPGKNFVLIFRTVALLKILPPTMHPSHPMLNNPALAQSKKVRRSLFAPHRVLLSAADDVLRGV